MKKAKLAVFFLLINFASLAIGSWLMNNGPRTEWYANLNKAPWTPPGWVFGFAWSLIMICFSFYLTKLFSTTNSQRAKIAYGVQIILNVSWNYIFFNQRQITFGLIILLLLNVVLFYFFFFSIRKVNNYRFLLLPYIAWMFIATSLNLYILIHN